ncbi:MAG: efflux RND transporter permease subunit [Synergistaceae bacterium]|jgi:HAE1 family hydrophobic/amphiphilic exporter-1|nr:efflux RND transporter permease subunit [Synergistaceae bacterium]
MGAFIRFCIRRPVFTWCGVIIFVLLGWTSYTTLGVTLYPDVEFPFVLVQTKYTGASPNEIEQLVSKPIEDALADLENLKTITSYSQDGISMVAVEMQAGTNPDLALVDVNNKVKAARQTLPDDIEEPICMKFDMNSQPFLTVSFTSTMPEKDAKKYIEDRIKPLAARVEGVGQVQVSGGRDREIQIILDPVALSDYNVTYQQICAVVAANNITNPSGYITQSTDEISLRLVGEFNEVEQLENIIIPAGEPIPLSLLGKVVDGEQDVRSIARANGQSVVQLRISPRANADVVTAGREVKKELETALKNLPEFSMTYTHDDTPFIETSVKNVIRDTAVGVALTALVIYLFLGRISATLIVAVSMPVAFMGTFIPMQGLGYTLNLMSTLGLALSMGTLVMNAILIIENIYRYRDLGYEPFEAAEKGTEEISVSVLAGVLTNLGVFLPVALMKGIAGQFLAPYAVTILYATLLSLWVTMSVTPCMAARIKSSGEISLASRILTGWWNWLYEGFKDMFMFFLRRSTRHPIVTLVIFMGLMYGSLKLGSLIGTQFIPVVDDGTITIELTLANSASIEETEKKTRMVEDFIETMPERKLYIRDVVATVGASFRSSSVYQSSISVYLKDDPHRPSTQDVADKIRPFLATLEGMEYVVNDTRSGFSDPIEIRVKGDDMSVLYSIAEEVRAKGRLIPGVRDLTIQTEMGKPELQISPIRWRLSPLGLNLSDLASIVKGYLIGNESGKFRRGGFEYDIKARLDRQKAGDIYTVEDLPIMTPYGLVPLKEMADVVWRDAPTEIRRIERERTVVIGGNVRYITAGEGNEKMRQLLSTFTLPEGYSFSFGGEAEDMAEDFAELFRAIAIAILITYIVVAAIMESWAYAFIILLTVPMSLIGVVPAMLVSGTSITLFALIGVIMLIGMVVNNAIVVVDFAETLRLDENVHPYQAIEQASEVRFKALVMAIATSVVSLLPLAMSTGGGAAMRSPIAVVAIGGLIAGGFLALLAIPAAYKIYWAVRLRLGRRKEKGEKEEAPQPV